MNQHLLLVSKDEGRFLAKFRSDALKSAGYRVSEAESLGRAVALTFSLHPSLVILEQAFSERERTAFIEYLHESYPGTQVLSLQYGDVRPDLLLKVCGRILSGQPGSRTVHTIQDFAVKKLA